MSSNKKRNFESTSSSPSSPESCEDILEYCKNLTADDLHIATEKWLKKISEERQTFLDQVPLILTAIQIHPIYYKYFTEICNDVQLVARTCYPYSKVEVHPFGSTVTLLALKDSDIDIFIDFGDIQEPPEVIAKKLRKEFFKKGRIFKQVFAIFAKVPIVRIKHRSDIFCDISFSNFLGVINSDLVRFFISLDDRVWPLIMIIKFWLKRQELNGSNAITSYALTMILVLYLQSMEKPILPTLLHLQSKTLINTYTADWSTSFSKDKSVIPNVENKGNLLDFLTGFFSFYANFEFGFYVVCPYSGKILLKPFFANANLLPPEYDLYRTNLLKDVSNRFEVNKFMCVQDPFKHSHNVTRNVPKKVTLKFQECCRRAYEICLEEKNHAKNTAYKSVFFRKLFHSVESNGSSKRPKRSDQRFEIFLGKDLLFNPNDSDFDEERLRCLWSEAVIKTLMDILTKIVKCKVVQQDDRAISIDENPINIVSSTVFHCEMHHLLLSTKKRSKARQELAFSQEDSALKREEMISNYLLDTVMKNVEPILIKFLINITIRKKPTHVAIELDTLHTDKSLKDISFHAFHLMETLIPKWVEKSLEV